MLIVLLLGGSGRHYKSEKKSIGKSDPPDNAVEAVDARSEQVGGLASGDDVLLGGCGTAPPPGSNSLARLRWVQRGEGEKRDSVSEYCHANPLPHIPLALIRAPCG